MHRTCRVNSTDLSKLTESLCSPLNRSSKFLKKIRYYSSFASSESLPCNNHNRKNIFIHILIAKCLVRTSIIFRQHFFQTAIGRFLSSEIMLGENRTMALG